MRHKRWEVGCSSLISVKVYKTILNKWCVRKKRERIEKNDTSTTTKRIQKRDGFEICGGVKGIESKKVSSLKV